MKELIGIAEQIAAKLVARKQTIAVIGPLANDKSSQLGPWAGNGQAIDAVTPLEAFRQKMGDDHVLYAKGVDIPPFESALGAGVAPNHRRQAHVGIEGTGDR